ncbi:hypothetical protein LY78DRAFT_651086 [Colletotrichum sublineola]|nr:hypothetical protein LY78DRAFT_651086 [Colletotrichum sublineola]
MATVSLQCSEDGLETGELDNHRIVSFGVYNAEAAGRKDDSSKTKKRRRSAVPRSA